MRKNAMWTLGLGLWLVMGVLPARAQFGQMQGLVKDEDGKPMANAVVSIDREDIRGHYEVKTDRNGKFFHAGLPLGRFSVSVKQKNGQDFKIGGIQTRMSEPASVEIDLQQEVMRAQAASQGIQVQGGANAPKLSEEQMAQIQAAARGDEKKQWYEKSMEAYQKALAMKADDASYHNNFALALANAGKLQEAQAELVKAAELDPPNGGRYFFNLGAGLINTNHIKEATEAFKKATEADPNFADAYFQLGVTLTGMASVDPSTGAIVPAPGTKEALEKYLQLAPSGPNAAAAKSLLETISGSVTTQVGGSP